MATSKKAYSARVREGDVKVPASGLLIGQSEACVMLGRPYNSLKPLEDAGCIHCVGIHGRARRKGEKRMYIRAEIEQYIAKQMQPAATTA